MFFANDQPTSSTENRMSYSKKEKFAIEIRCKDRAHTISQKRSLTLNSLENHFSVSMTLNDEKDAYAFIEELTENMKNDNYIEILPLSLEKIQTLITRNEKNLDFLIKNNMIKILCAILTIIDAKGYKGKESTQCLEILSWITINITAGSQKDTRLLIENEIIKYFVSILMRNQNITVELLENILWTFCNILLEFYPDSFFEIYENQVIFTKLFDYKHLFLKQSKCFTIIPKFLNCFTHNPFFYTMTHQSNFIAKLLELLNLCISDFPENLLSLSLDEEEFLNESFSSLIDVINFLDDTEFFLAMQDNLGLLLKMLFLLQKYNDLMRDSALFMKFFLQFLDRTNCDKQLWSLMEIDKVFLEILNVQSKPMIFEKIIECVALMINNSENEEDSHDLFNLFSDSIFRNFQTNDLKIKHQCIVFFHCVLEKIGTNLEYANKLFEYFNRSYLYQEIIMTIDSNIPEIVIGVLNFLKSYLEIGEIIKEEKFIKENICTIRIYVKEFCLNRIESLILYPDETISNMSAEIYEKYFSD